MSFFLLCTGTVSRTLKELTSGLLPASWYYLYLPNWGSIILLPRDFIFTSGSNIFAPNLCLNILRSIYNWEISSPTSLIILVVSTAIIWPECSRPESPVVDIKSSSHISAIW